MLATVRLADCAPQPWRNGGGLTRELLAWAPDDGPWQVRVSVADITRDGPFSAFPGVERGFAVLEGAGVRLDVDGVERRLTPDDAPLHFAGEAAPGCRLIDGPTRDLNLMAPRSAGVLTMRRAAPGDVLDGRHRWRALYAASNARLGAPADLHLPAGTLAWSADASALPPWHLLQGAHCFWLALA